MLETIHGTVSPAQTGFCFSVSAPLLIHQDEDNLAVIFSACICMAYDCATEATWNHIEL